MRLRGFILSLLLAATLPIALSACGNHEGPAEKAGKKVDQTAEQAGQALENTKDKAAEKAQKMDNNIGQKTQD